MLTLFLLCQHLLFAQQQGFRFTDATELTIVGKSMPTVNPYHRADTTLYNNLPPRIKELLTHTAGLAISFHTNSRAIKAKWCVSQSKPYPNLTPIANKGLDLYIKRNGKWQFAGVGKPSGLCNESTLIDHMDDGEKECLLYLPLYDAVRKLEIGIEDKASVTAGAEPFRKRILVYGSSIVQGAGASRPGMAYPAQLSRRTGYNFLNLGMSGSARMETAVADMLKEIKADVYIIDAVPNSSPAQITERAGNLIRSIRKNHPDAPIIVMQSIIREQGYFNQQMGDMAKHQNINIQKEVMKLLDEDMKNLYFITAEQLTGYDHESSSDGTHPNDLGYYRMMVELEKSLKEIFARSGIDQS